MRLIEGEIGPSRRNEDALKVPTPEKRASSNLSAVL